MQIFPDKERWRKWSLPAKCSYLGIPLAILILIISLILPRLIGKDYSKLSHEILQKLEENNISEKEIEELFYRVEKDLDEKIDKETWDKYANIILSIYQRIDSTCTIKLNEKIFCDQTKKTRIIDLV